MKKVDLNGNFEGEIRIHKNKKFFKMFLPQTKCAKSSSPEFSNNVSFG